MGGSWELFAASRSTKEGFQIHLGTLLGPVCVLLAAEDGLASVVGLSLARSELLGVDFEIPNAFYHAQTC